MRALRATGLNCRCVTARSSSAKNTSPIVDHGPPVGAAVRRGGPGLFRSQKVHEKHWLHGLKDQYVGRALAALHDRLSHGWSVAYMAEVAGLSRSAFVVALHGGHGNAARRQYLAKSRMLLAKELLVERQKSISQIAAAVGYDAEAAFNRALKRESAYPLPDGGQAASGVTLSNLRSAVISSRFIA